MGLNRGGGGWRGRVTAGAIAATAVGTALPLSSLHTDASGPMTTVIVRGAGPGCMQSVGQAVAQAGGGMTYQLPILDGAVAVVPMKRVAQLASDECVAAVTPDGTLQLDSTGPYQPAQDVGSLVSTEQIIGAQQLWQRGYTGAGVGVALIDTGVAPVQGLSGSGQVINGPDLSFDSQAPQLTYNDEYGHGTHMAGIIAGNDLYGQGAKGSKYAGDRTDFLGVAPDAHIVNLKVGDENGVVDVSQVLASIDWAVQHAADPGLNIRVINLSFGTQSSQSYVLDPLAFAAEQAWHDGIVVVASAGNDGPSSDGLNDPAYDPYLIAVGAADTENTVPTGDDQVASFSSAGDGTRNPDLVAPAVHIASLRDPGSVLDQEYGSTATVATRFFRGSGTSQAAAVVSGAAALLLSAYPNATPDQIKYALDATATSLKGQPAAEQGHGELNLNNVVHPTPALNALVSALTGTGPAAAAGPPAPPAPPGPPAPPAPPGGPAATGSQVNQAFAQATGLGTLEASRGGMHVVANGVTLSGEEDIMGNAFNAAAMANLESNGAAWSGGTWNGAAWSGAGWSGAGWSGAAWSGAGWSGAGWSGAAWSGSTWNGAGWSGSGFSGAGWSGAGWSGAGWSGAAWSGAAWSGAGWSDATWS